MIFLIEYDRSLGRLVMLKSFAESSRQQADEARLDLELELHRSHVDHEVGLLEAESEEAIRRTHRRYFETIDELARSISEA